MSLAAIWGSIPASPAMAQPAFGRPLPREAVTRQKATLREGPSIEAAVLAQLPGGTSVTVIGEDGLWRQVRGGEAQGWVHAALLR